MLYLWDFSLNCWSKSLFSGEFDRRTPTVPPVKILNIWVWNWSLFSLLHSEWSSRRMFSSCLISRCRTAEGAVKMLTLQRSALWFSPAAQLFLWCVKGRRDAARGLKDRSDAGNACYTLAGWDNSCQPLERRDKGGELRGKTSGAFSSAASDANTNFWLVWHLN